MKKISDEAFFWSIKLVCVGALAILALGLAFSAHAATPVAVWDGDFTKTIEGYTLNLNGNTEKDGVITIDQSKGVTVDFANAMTSGMTVMFRYSDLPLGSQQTIATSRADADLNDLTGVYLDANNLSHGIWKTTTTYDKDVTTQGTMASDQTAGKFSFTYKALGGTQLYRIADGNCTTIYNNTTLHTSTSGNSNGCALGGTRAGSTFAAATGLKISAIAIFGGVLTEDEMKAYVFPSDEKKENAYLWLDASADDTIVTNTSGNVTSWTTRSSSGKAATAYSAGGVSKGPTVSPGVLARNAVVDFGGADSGLDLQFDRSTNIRAVFMVADVTQSPKAFFLGDTSAFNFHRGEESQYFSGHTSLFSQSGAVRRNQTVVSNPQGTVVPTGYALYTLTPSAGAIASRICQDRAESGRNGGKRIAEMIIFTCEISDEARDEIETYLTDKWFPKPTAIVTQSANWSDLAWTPAVPSPGEDVILINNGADGVTTVTVDSPVTVGKLTVRSAEGKELELARFGANMTASSFDFSKAKGGVGIGVKDGWTVTDALRNYIRDNDVEVAFHGADDKGATLAYALNSNKSIQGHIAFEGGQHALTYGNSVAGGALFGANASLENPTILVKGGATLDFTGKDLCGWTGAADKNGVIKVENGGRINMKDSGGTVYYRQRIALDPGAEFYVDMAENNFRLQGGAVEGKEQLYVPAGTGTAYIKPTDVSRDSIYLAKDETRGFGVFVGAGSTLDIQTKLACQEDAENKNNFEIAKYGAGTLKLSGDISGYWNQGYDGYVVKFSVHAGDLELATAEDVKCQIWSNSGTNLKLTGDGTKVSGYLDGPGKVVCDTTGEVFLSRADNTYSGGTVIEKGVLVVNANNTLGTGTVTVKEGAQLDLNGWGVTATFAGNGTICNSSPTPASVNGIRVLQNESIQLSDGLSIHLAEGETLTLTSVPPANKVKISGEGRVEFESESVPTLPAGLWAEDWTGTFAWSGFNGAAIDWNPTSYYNGTNSVFEFSGTITSGYFWKTTVAKNPFGELVLKGDIKFTDGYTHPSKEETAICQYIFTRLSGTKAWTIETSSEASSGIVIGDMSGFTGSFTVKSSNGNGGYRIVVGDGELSVDIDSLTKAAFHFTGNATLASTSLVASRGYFVRPYATLTMAGYPIFYSTTLTFAENAALCLMDHNCKATCHYGVTIDAGVTIPVTVIDAKGLTAGESLIIWNATPEGDFALNVGPGIAKGTPGLVASKTKDGLVAAADNTKTFFEVGDTAAAERPTTIFENAWLKDAGVWPDEATVDEIQQNLDTPNAAGITPGQAYLAGFAADEVADAAVTINIALLPDTGKVRIHATGLPPIYERRNNAVITYALLSTADVTDWTSATRTDMGVDTTVDVDLEDEQQFYRVSAEIELSTGSSEIIAVVPSVNVVASGMPLLTNPGTQFAASLGTATLDAPTDTLTFQLAGAGVTEGQTYHLEVHEQQANGAPAVYGVVAHVLSDKTVTFDFAHTVPANTTVKLTLISDSGAANGNVCAVSTVQPTTSTFAADTIVSARMGLLPYDDGIATMASPKMPQQYRIPAIATDGNGEVIACFDCRYGKSDLGATWDSGNGDGWVFSGIDIAENYSSDNGKTFGETHLAVDVGNMRDQTGAWVGGYANRCNSAYIVKERDIGDVCVLFDPAGNGGDGLYWMMGLTGGGLSTVGTATEKTDVVLYTRKRGKDSKWENRRSVKWEILGSLGVTTATVGLGFLEGPGHGIVTTKACTIKGENVPAGTLVFPIQVFTSGSVWRSEAGAAYSTDGGKTWKTTALTTDKDNGSPQENCIMELDDGTWYMCTKCCGAGYYRTYRYNHANDSWVKVENGAPCPSARQGSCLRMGVGADGRGRYAICHARNDRANVVVYFGKDVSTPGETPSTTNRGIQWDWDNYITIHKENTSGGYSSMCMVDDTTLGILYETNYGAGTDGGNDPSGCRMYFTRIDVSDKVVAP